MDDIIEEFHRMWDAFPGMARLIRTDHTILAANEAARTRGFVEGACCAKVGTLETHRGCLMRAMVESQSGQVDMPSPDKARGWLPVQGHDDLFVHFTLFLTQENSSR